MCKCCKPNKPRHSELKRRPAPNRAVSPKPKRKKARPFLIVAKYIGRRFWTSKPSKWEVFKRYPTERARDEAYKHFVANSYYAKHYNFWLTTEADWRTTSPSPVVPSPSSKPEGV